MQPPNSFSVKNFLRGLALLTRRYDAVMLRPARDALVALAVLVGVSAVAATSSTDRQGCGAPGKAPCPLQAWMRINMAAPLAASDLRKLATNLEALRGLNPDRARWTNWERFASDGARAARDGNASTTMRSCTSCHDVYRTRYNEQFRERAVSSAP